MEIHSVLSTFHRSWLIDNAEFFQQQAVNSAYITSRKYLTDMQRQVLFEFIGSDKIANVLHDVIPLTPAFMGTQLFFDPANDGQRNYWHRDIQYNELTIEQQQSALQTVNALHLRVPLKKERGLELVPATHRRWDTAVEYDVRLAQNGKHPHDDLSSGQVVPLDRGDLLVFSAHMIHRGLYGGDRFALDILFGDSKPELTKYVPDDCLPDREMLDQIQNATSFVNTMRSRV